MHPATGATATEPHADLPQSFTLTAAYPNPFNAGTVFRPPDLRVDTLPS